MHPAARSKRWCRRDEGLVKFIGVTGHGVRIAGRHLESLQRFDYDSVLLPMNFALLDRPDYRHDFETLLALCDERQVAVQTIKSIARGRWEAGFDGPKFSWYEPLADPGAIARAVSFVLSRPNVFLNSTSDAGLLPTVLDAAEGEIAAPTDSELRDDVERFGITALFDGAALERI